MTDRILGRKDGRGGYRTGHRRWDEDEGAAGGGEDEMNTAAIYASQADARSGAGSMDAQTGVQVLESDEESD